MAPDPWGVSAVEDAPAVKDPWGVASVDDAAPAPLSGPVGAVPVPTGLQGPPARGISSSPDEVLSTVGSHALNAVAGPASTIGAPAQGMAEKVAQAAMPGGLQLYRTAIKPSIAPARRAIQQVGQGDFSGAARSAESAIPVVGPWADQVEGDVANKGAVAGMAGLATDVLAPAAAGKVVAALPGAMEKSAAGIWNRTVGSRQADFARGANPGRGAVDVGIGPSGSMESIAEKAGDARREVGQALGNAYSQADASGKVIPAGDVSKAINDVIDKAKKSASSPGVMQDPDTYEALRDTFQPALQNAAARPTNGFTPSELWNIRKTINDSLNWGDQSRLNMTRTQQRVSGALGGLLEDAVPEAADLNQHYQDLTKLTSRAQQRANTHSSPLTGIVTKGALSGAGALLGTATHGPLGAAGGAAIGAALDSVPVKTMVAAGLGGAGKVLKPAIPIARNAPLPATLAAVAGNGQPQAPRDPEEDRNDQGTAQEVDQVSPSKQSIPENETNTFPQPAISSLPSPVRRVLSSTGLNLQPAKPHMGAQGNPAIASVDPRSPNTINIEDPARFSQSGTQTLSHEAVHLWHNNLAPAIQSQIPEDDQKDPYNYGGAEGLKSMRDQGMKLWNLPREKAATIVQYYASQGGKDAPKAVRDAYEPWVKDMNNVPLSTIKPTEPESQSLETSPRPPLGQMYSTQVFAKGDADSGAAYDTGPLTGKPIPGMLQRGNIDVNHRPQIHNADGSMSSIFSMTIPVDKDGSPWGGRFDKAPRYALVPSIANGKFLTPDGKIPKEGDKSALGALEDAATDYYGKTREHLGLFNSPDAADKYASATHAWGNDGTDTKVFAPSYKGDSNLVINPGPQTAAPTGTPGGYLPAIPQPVNPMYSTQIFKKGESDKKPAMQKGTPVTLPDGTKGKVAHVIQGMGTVRVRTDDGRNLTVRAKALTVLDGNPVKAHVRGHPDGKQTVKVAPYTRGGSGEIIAPKSGVRVKVGDMVTHRGSRGKVSGADANGKIRVDWQ